ncbi:SDR family oxidoreductase [Arenicella sp. 4NH20-0111]|uniref:SDR family NAD(P)-dependent oxidoreductase n=1 Tax=Arenicella sp. 4NH20-0111 TaxID=3127648 RepID=UPI00310AE7AF
MNLQNKIVVVTGAANGIGAAVARAFSAKGARLVLSDINLEALQPFAAELKAVAVECDATSEADILNLVAQAEKLGPIDLFFSNAGYAEGEPSHAASASNATWEKNWQLHVMAHVYASRALLPKMIERSEGYLVNVASAAGLLQQISDAAYSATKHAAVSFAESLAISHADDGIKVSVVCPQYVNTNILSLTEEERAAELPGVITPEECARVIVEGIEQEKFLILPHSEVQGYVEHRAVEREAWLDGMRRYRRSLLDGDGNVDFRRIFSK